MTGLSGSNIGRGKLRVMQRRGLICLRQSPLTGFCVRGSTSYASGTGWRFFFYHLNNCELFVGVGY